MALHITSISECGIMSTVILLCKHPGCDRIRTALGYCDMHYRRMRRGQNLDDPVPQRNRTCDISWCNRKHYAVGLCKMHYFRKRRGADMDKVPQFHGKGRLCEVECCTRPHFARGFCDCHYGKISQRRRYKWPYHAEASSGRHEQGCGRLCSCEGQRTWKNILETSTPCRHE